MKKHLFLAAIAMCSALSALAWGQKGHDVVVYIAEKHLTPQAKAAVEAVLDGHSMVYYANWLDNASNTPEYAYSKTWHYKNIDAGQTYNTAPKNDKGDIVLALEEQINKLKNGNLAHEEEALALKMVIHLLGDLHQPLHMGHLSDLGGNKWMVKSFNRDTNLHSYWDTELVEFIHKWSYSEWQYQIDRATPEQEAEIVAGDVDRWAQETYGICTEVYDGSPVGTSLRYEYGAKWAPVVEQQLLHAGLRLAAILNSIYK